MGWGKYVGSSLLTFLCTIYQCPTCSQKYTWACKDGEGLICICNISARCFFLANYLPKARFQPTTLGPTCSRICALFQNCIRTAQLSWKGQCCRFSSRSKTSSTSTRNYSHFLTPSSIFINFTHFISISNILAPAASADHQHQHQKHQQQKHQHRLHWIDLGCIDPLSDHL